MVKIEYCEYQQHLLWFFSLGVEGDGVSCSTDLVGLQVKLGAAHTSSSAASKLKKKSKYRARA